MIKLAINGFGRIGRSIFRAALMRGNFDIVALNDIGDWEILSYLIEHDSTHGRLSRTLPLRPYYNASNLTLDFYPPTHSSKPSLSPISLHRFKSPLDSEFGLADIVIEASGHFLDTPSLKPYHQAGAKHVILAASPLDSMPTFAMGINHTSYHDEPIISNASCTANALAPLLSILDNAFGVETATFSITHSYTSEQSLLDNAPHSPSSDKRRSRAATQNLIPTSTGATQTLARLLPHLANRLSGHCVRVPVANMLLLDLCVNLRTKLDINDLNHALSEATNTYMRGIARLDCEFGVSSDFIGDSHSVIIAKDLSYIASPKGDMVRLLAWSDNEWGYANRVLDLAEYIMGHHLKSSNTQA